MSRGPQAFTESEVTRAVKAVVTAGVKVGRIEIYRGKIIVIAEGSETPSTEQSADDNLDRELAEFEARNGQG
jgi:hypothetical protein